MINKGQHNMNKVYVVAIKTDAGDYINGVFSNIDDANDDLNELLLDHPEYDVVIKTSFASSVNETLHI